MTTASKNIVIDASVLIKFFVNEIEDQAACQALKHDVREQRIHLHAPFLLYWELGNFFGREFTQEQADQAWSHLNLLKIHYHAPTLETAHWAFHLMKKIPKASFYETSYHALAMSEDILFLTCDQKYYEQAHRFQHIVLLQDYPLTFHPDSR